MANILKCFYKPKHHKGGFNRGDKLYNERRRKCVDLLLTAGDVATALLLTHKYMLLVFLSTGVQIMQEALPSTQFYTKPLCILHHCILLLLSKTNANTCNCIWAICWKSGKLEKLKNYYIFVKLVPIIVKKFTYCEI